MRLLRAITLTVLALAAGAASAQTPCVGGSAGGYPCLNVDLGARLPLSTFTSPGTSAPSAANDIWGWTDATTGKEYALVGLTNGTAFVDVSDPAAPVYLGKLPTATSNSSWRDIKTVGDFAFIVSEASSHGMQVFDLTRLRSVASPPVTFTDDGRYTGFGSAHNIVAIEGTDYVVGVGSFGASCSGGGLHIVDVSSPRTPTFAGCYDGDGYTHDAQCLVYDGPDTDHTGREICVASNEDTVTIVDVTSKAAPVELSKAFYPNPSYTHQGWFAAGKRYFVVNDELDEGSIATRTIVMDLLDLDDPDFAFFHDGTTGATDHNLYVVGDLVYQSNYTAGLQVLEASSIGAGALAQVAMFDTEPATNGPGASSSTGGQWSNYPFFASGTVVANDIKNGLFVLSPRTSFDPSASVTPSAVEATVPEGGTASRPVTVENGPGGGSLTYEAALANVSQPEEAAPAAPLGAQALAGRPQGLEALDDRAAKDAAALAPPPPGFVGAGGPDAFGYAWIDSDEPGGPAVGFQDISGTGTAVAFTATGSFDPDDEGVATVALPFTFDFYGVGYNEVIVNTNGYLTFGPTTGNSWTNPSAFPGTSSPTDIDNVVAPFWDDLDQSAGGATYYGTLPDGRFVVQYDGVARYSDSGSSLTFQVLLSDDGTIEFQYGTLTTGTLTSNAIGLENADASVGLTVAANTAYVSSDHAVLFYSPTVWVTLSGPLSGTLDPGESAEITVEFDAAELAAGTYTADLVVTTNDPAAPSTTVPVTLTVGDDGTPAIVIDGGRGVRYLGPPAEGVTVDDLAAQNLVRGVPSYYPTAPTNLWTGYDPVAGEWVPSLGAGEELALGRAFRWYLLDSDGPGDPEVSRSVELPFTLSTERPANEADLVVELSTDGNRFNHLANPFGTALYLDGYTSWPGAPGIRSALYVYDDAAASWELAPASIGPWEAFRFRAKGPRRNGNPRFLQIPASATTPPPPATREASRPALTFRLEGTTAAGRPLADGMLALSFEPEASAAVSIEEDVEKFQPASTAYALLGARVGGDVLGLDARPWGPAEVPLALEARGAAPAFTLRWDASALPTGLPVALVDLATGAEVDVRAQSSYAFRAASRPALADVPTADLADGAAATDRFVLRIGDGLAAAEAAPEALSLEAPAPNPTASTARVGFALPAASTVRLAVYDARGREVAVLAEGRVEAGRHEVDLEAASLAAGVYVVRLEADGRVLTQRAAVVR